MELKQKLTKVKQFYKTNKQKIMAGSFAVIWAFSTIFAVFTDTDVVSNRFKSTQNVTPVADQGEIRIGEKFVHDSEVKDKTTTDKDVWVYNTTNKDVFVRMFIESVAFTARTDYEIAMDSDTEKPLVTWDYSQVDRSSKYLSDTTKDTDGDGLIDVSLTSTQDNYITLTVPYTYTGTDTTKTGGTIKIQVNLANINIDDGQTGEQWEFIGTDNGGGKFYYTDDLEGITDSKNAAYQHTFAKDNTLKCYNEADDETATDAEKSKMAAARTVGSATSILIDSVYFDSGTEAFEYFTLKVAREYEVVTPDKATAAETCDAVKRDGGRFMDGEVGQSWANIVGALNGNELTSINWNMETNSEEVDETEPYRVTWFKSLSDAQSYISANTSTTVDTRTDNTAQLATAKFTYNKTSKAWSSTDDGSGAEWADNYYIVDDTGSKTAVRLSGNTAGTQLESAANYLKGSTVTAALTNEIVVIPAYDYNVELENTIGELHMMSNNMGTTPYVYSYLIDDASNYRDAGNLEHYSNAWKAFNPTTFGTHYDPDGLYFGGYTITGIRIPVKGVASFENDSKFMIEVFEVDNSNSWGASQTANKGGRKTKNNASGDKSGITTIEIPKGMLKARNQAWIDSSHGADIQSGPNIPNDQKDAYDSNTGQYTSGSRTYKQGTPYIIEDYVDITGLNIVVPEGYTVQFGGNYEDTDNNRKVSIGFLNSDDGKWTTTPNGYSQINNAPWKDIIVNSDYATYVANVEKRYFLNNGVFGCGHCLMFDFLLNDTTSTAQNANWQAWLDTMNSLDIYEGTSASGTPLTSAVTYNKTTRDDDLSFAVAVDLENLSSLTFDGTTYTANQVTSGVDLDSDGKPDMTATSGSTIILTFTAAYLDTLTAGTTYNFRLKFKNGYANGAFTITESQTKKIAVIGDSISTLTGATNGTYVHSHDRYYASSEANGSSVGEENGTYGATIAINENCMWYNVAAASLTNALDDTYVLSYNNSVAGAGVTDVNSRGAASSRDLSGIADADIIAVYLGTNDFGNDATTANFKSSYEALLSAIAAKNSNAKIYLFTCTPGTNFGSANYNDPVKAENLNSVIRYEANKSTSDNVYLVELYGQTLSLSNDGLHPDATGQSAIASQFVKAVGKDNYFWSFGNEIEVACTWSGYSGFNFSSSGSDWSYSKNISEIYKGTTSGDFVSSNIVVDHIRVRTAEPLTKDITYGFKLKIGTTDCYAIITPNTSISAGDYITCKLSTSPDGNGTITASTNSKVTVYRTQSTNSDYTVFKPGWSKRKQNNGNSQLSSSTLTNADSILAYYEFDSYNDMFLFSFTGTCE